MLAFRNWFLALAVVLLTATVASASLNAPALQCVANAGVPPIVRAEGIAELVGDMVLNCTGGYPALFRHDLNVPENAGGSSAVLGPAAVPQVNVQIFLNTNVTSRLLSTSTNNNEALLMIDEPTDAQQLICQAGGSGCALPTPLPTAPLNLYKQAGVYNMWQGRWGGSSSPNTVNWLGVPIDAPGTQWTRIIRITNIRADASYIGVSSTLVPNDIKMYISITGSTSIPINNPTQTVAWVQKGLNFRTRNLADDGGASTSLKQCSSRNKDQMSDPNKNEYSCVDTRLIFEELFATAWKTRFTGGPLSGANQNNPGSIYNMSESGFFRATDNGGWGASMAGWAGVATQGTRLRVQFNNVPDGVVLYVTTHPVIRSGDAFVSYSPTSNVNNDAALVQVANDGSGNYVVIDGTAYLKKSASDFCTKDTGFSNLMRISQVPLFGGTGVAVWEVIATDPLAVQRMDFGLVVSYVSDTSNNLPKLGTAKANGSFAPISDMKLASVNLAAPRFTTDTISANAFGIIQCVTNLLFPFVTNQGGFNTGMVISNTTKDPYGTTNQQGTCSIYYYGDTNGGAPPPKQDSGVVPAGDYLAFDLMTGGKFGMAATPGFQGYVIAQCRFQLAHGYAFISDVKLTVANGYLALVLDRVDTGIRLGSSYSGENLGN